MTKNQLKQTLFLLAITACLAVPVLISLLICRSTQYLPTSVPYRLDSWAGTDFEKTAWVKKNYTSPDVNLTWRRYQCTGLPPVDCVIQQTNTSENLHDVFACLILADAHPKRLATIRLPGSAGGVATVFETTLENRRCYTLFCYQSKFGSAVYPPDGLFDQAQLAAMRKFPCRLFEANTEAVPDGQAAIERLTRFAQVTCSQPI